MTILKISDISVSYGHVEALKNINIEANEGEIFSIIGSNGAGKTSLLRTISGMVKPETGSIEFKNEELPSKVHQIVQNGIVHIP